MEHSSEQDSGQKQNESATKFTFGTALIFLKRGMTVRRAGWNSKGMYLMLQQVEIFAVKRNGEALRVLPWIGMRTADACWVPWLASQTDLLASDWEIV